jgi:hypothetical protein
MTQKERDKKKKKQKDNNWLEAEVMAIMEKGMKACLD